MARHSKYMCAPIPGAQGTQPTFKAVLVEQSRFGCAELVRLRVERGVGNPARIDPGVRAVFIPTKRG